MKKINFSLFIGCIFFLWYSSSVAQTTEQGAKITQLVGTVDVRSSEKAAWRSARVGMPVRQNWDVRTFLESSAEITIETGTVLKISENTVMSLSQLSKNEKENTTQSNVKILTGQMWANVKKISNTNSKMEFETPTAVASIRGTRLGIEVSKERTRIDVFEGLVAVRKRNSDKSVSVKPNFRAEIENSTNNVTVVEFKDIKTDTTSGASIAPADPFTSVGNPQKDSISSMAIPDSVKSGNLERTGNDTVPVIDSTNQTNVDSTNAAPQEINGQSFRNPSGNDSAGIHNDSMPVAKKESVITPGNVNRSDTTISNVSKTTAAIPSVSGTVSLQILSPASGSIVMETPVILRGKTTPGASVKISNKKIETGSDGSFAEMLELKPGKNTTNINASLNGKQINQTHILEYHPKLELSVQNIENNMEVSSKNIQLDISVSENAKFSVNGKAGEVSVTLVEGKNTIIVEAWDVWNARLVQQYQVLYKPAGKFTLNVVSPSAGLKIKEPFIQVTGSTSAGAKVYVNGVLIQVGRDGFFSSRIPVADEQQQYTLEIRAEYNGEEQVIERSVVYEPVKEKLNLEVSSPQNGQIVDRKAIRFTGKTSPKTQVVLNNITVPVMANGTFTYEYPIQEKDIGEYTLDIVARNEDQEITRTINVMVNGKSNQVNTSIPQCIVQAKSQQAVRTPTVTIQAIDRTPEDELTIIINNNGVSEIITTESGNNEQYTLLEGKNQYSITVKDKALNISNTVTGQIYYLPGPLYISFIEPSSNPMVVKGVPPMPGRQGLKPVRVEIEIEDGIGTVPETIKYCKLIGNGQTILLRNNNDYIYKGELPIVRGNNYYTVFVEDIAGNTISTKLEISIE